MRPGGAVELVRSDRGTLGREVGGSEGSLKEMARGC